MLAAFLVKMPLQTRVLAFFSTGTEYANALQVIWYASRRASSAEGRLRGDSAEGDAAEALLETDQSLRPAPMRKAALLASGVVAALLAVLVMFVLVFVPQPLNFGLLSAEAALVAVCLIVPRRKRLREQAVTE